MLAGAYAFVDLETTGCNPVYDRITEIAIVSVRDGVVTERWQQLLDPGMSIPEAIQSLTGITNAMVAGQPGFEDVADEVQRRLDGATFVAHNARFDHGFLRNALKRCNLALRGPVLCTVKLSRRLFPQHPRHNLDAIIARHGLTCAARHRALGDAEATWQFVAQLAASGTDLAPHIDTLTKRPSLPARLSWDALDAIPDTPGVYLFYDERDTPLYVGKSVRLRSRVLAHFAADHSSHREMQMAQQTARVEWRESAGELGALLREAQLVKDLAPVYNRKLRRHAKLVSIRWSGAADGIPEIVGGSDIAGDALAHLHGLFRSKAQAKKALLGLADEYRLCLRLAGLEKPAPGACFRHQVGKCGGACAGQEPLLAHQARLAAALAKLKLVSWPWSGAIGIREQQPDSGLEELHVVDRWCYLGTFRSEDELHAREAFARRPAFDMDTYKLLVKHLMRSRHPQVVPFAPVGPDLSGQSDS
jgi:DNA polymerase-3 subunit epsilon